jgi:hypothetical protein
MSELGRVVFLSHPLFGTADARVRATEFLRRFMQ